MLKACIGLLKSFQTSLEPFLKRSKGCLKDLSWHFNGPVNALKGQKCSNEMLALGAPGFKSRESMRDLCRIASLLETGSSKLVPCNTNWCSGAQTGALQCKHWRLIENYLVLTGVQLELTGFTWRPVASC